MSEKLYQAMGDISEKHILEAEQFSATVQNGSATSGGGALKNIRRHCKVWGALAAWLALLVTLGALGHIPWVRELS